MRDNFSDRGHQQNILGHADQTEWHAVKSGESSVEQGVYDDQVAGTMEDFSSTGGSEDGDESPEWVDHDMTMDTAAGDLRHVMEDRHNVLGSAYPFEIDGGQIVYRASESYAYEFFLALTQSDLSRQFRSPRQFEQVSRQLVQSYLGSASKSVHVGWPRDEGVAFKNALSGLSGDTSEWVWNPNAGLPNDPSPRYVKDGGLDFVAWQPHLDKRPGHLFVLGQCAAGQDWENKFNDLNPARLEQWFSPMTWVPPVQAFCTPYHITDGHLRQAAPNLVFDRLRLVLLAEKICQSAGDDTGNFPPLIQELRIFFKGLTTSQVSHPPPL